jgi:hypothetical protein
MISLPHGGGWYKQLTLPLLEATGFLLHLRSPAIAGLTPGPQAFYFPWRHTAKV